MYFIAYFIPSIHRLLFEITVKTFRFYSIQVSSGYCSACSVIRFKSIKNKLFQGRTDLKIKI